MWQLPYIIHWRLACKRCDLGHGRCVTLSVWFPVSVPTVEVSAIKHWTTQSSCMPSGMLLHTHTREPSILSRFMTTVIQASGFTTSHKITTASETDAVCLKRSCGPRYPTWLLRCGATLEFSKKKWALYGPWTKLYGVCISTESLMQHL